MEEAKDYKKYLKFLKEATSKKGPKNIKPRKIMGIAGFPGVQGLLVARSVIKKKRGGDTPGLKDYVKKSGQNDAYKKALEKYRAKEKQYSTGPQKGKMSNKRLSEMVSRMGKKKTLDKLRDMRGTISDKELDFATSMLPKMNTGGAMLKNPGKADLDKDGKLSGYEKKRGMAIEKSMSGKPMKAALGAIALGLGAKKMMNKKGKKMPLGLGAAALLADKKKKILGRSKGGSMMNKPMGYKKGTMIMARGCKLGRKKATKIT